MPARAHLNPALGIVKELVKLKHEVIVYNAPEFKNEIENTGAKFRLPPQKLPDVNDEIGRNALTLANLLIDTTTKLVSSYVY